METSKLLADVLTKYAVPDPKIVSKLPKGGDKNKDNWKNCQKCGGWHAINAIHLDFVGHADITRILIEIDPLWTWEPIAYFASGVPAYEIVNGMAHMAGRMTVHGKTMIGVGSCESGKPDLLKELISDFLRNAAMRFGVSLALWTKNEWEDLGPTIPVATVAPAKKSAPKTADPDKRADLEAVTKFIHVCAQNNIDHDQVADRAGVDMNNITESGLAKLRVAYKEIKENKK